MFCKERGGGGMHTEELFLIKQQLQEKVSELRIKYYDNVEVLQVLNDMSIAIAGL